MGSRHSLPDNRDNEEVHGPDLANMVPQEGPPRGRRRFPPTAHVARDGRGGELDPDLLQLAGDMRRAPQGIGQRHAPNDTPDLPNHGGRPGLPARLSFLQ